MLSFLSVPPTWKVLEILRGLQKPKTYKGMLFNAIMLFMVVPLLGQFWPDKVKKVRKYSENTSSFV